MTGSSSTLKVVGKNKPNELCGRDHGLGIWQRQAGQKKKERNQTRLNFDQEPETDSLVDANGKIAYKGSSFFENLKWLTSREAVVYLRLPSVGALRNLVYQRKIPYAKLGRSLRFDRVALDRFLESSSTSERKIA